EEDSDSDSGEIYFGAFNKDDIVVEATDYRGDIVNLAAAAAAAARAGARGSVGGGVVSAAFTRTKKRARRERARSTGPGDIVANQESDQADNFNDMMHALV